MISDAHEHPAFVKLKISMSNILTIEIMIRTMWQFQISKNMTPFEQNRNNC